MKIKKNYIFLLFAILFYNCPSSANEFEIWGLWNLGPEEYADIPYGELMRTWDYLSFRENYYSDGPRISYDGGHYKIKSIISRYANKVSLFLEYYQQKVNYEGNLDPIFGKVIMHFVDNDHMWMELDYNDKKYPTDAQFATEDFQGPNIVYWRAQEILNKVIQPELSANTK